MKSTYRAEIFSVQLEEEKALETLKNTFQCVKGAYKTVREGLLTRACRDRTRKNGFKLKDSRFRLDIRNFF